MSTLPNFTFLPLEHNATLVSWSTPAGHDIARIHDRAHAEALAAADLPGFTSEAASAYLAKYYPEDAA